MAKQKASFSPAMASRLLADVAKSRNNKNTHRGLRPSLGATIYAVKPEGDIAEGSTGSCKIQKIESDAFVEVSGLEPIECRSISGTALSDTAYIAARDPYGTWYIAAGSDAGSGGSDGGSCCCPDGAYKLALPTDWETLYPDGISTDQKTAFLVWENEYIYSGTTYVQTFEILSEISESLMKDGSVLRERITIKYAQSGPTPPFFTSINPKYLWPSDNGFSADGWHLLQVPDGWPKTTRPTRREDGFGTSDPYGITDGIFDDTGTDTLVLEFVVRSTNVSGDMEGGRIGLFFDSSTQWKNMNINRFFKECIDGSPDADGDGEGDETETVGGI